MIEPSPADAPFHELADHAPVMLWVTAADGCCTFLNRAWYAFTGQTPAAALGHGWLDAIHPDDRPAAAAAFADATRTRSAFRLDYRLRRHDGEYRWAIDSGGPRVGPGGEFLGFVGSVLDITDRKRAEDARRAADAQYRTLFDSIEDGFCVVAFEGGTGGRPLDYRVVEANPALARQSGLADPVGRTARELLGGEADGWIAAYAAVLDSGTPARFERPLDVTGRWLDVYAFPAGGRRVGIIFRDVSARHRLEADLRASDERFRALADTVPQIVYVSRPDGRIEFVNRRWAEYTGAAGADPDDLPAVVHPDDLPGLRAAWEAAAAAGEAFTTEFRLRRHGDGAYRWFLSRSVPARGDDGRVARWFGTSTDIDDQKALENDLRLAEERAAVRAAELEAVLRAVPAAVWIATDPGCRTVVGNPESYRLLGAAEGANVSATPGPGAAVDRPFREFVAGRPVPPDELPLQRAAAGAEVRAVEMELRFDAGPPVYVYGNAAPLAGPGGAVRGAVAAFVDVTAQRKQADELAASRARLEESFALLDTLIDNAPVGLSFVDADFRYARVNRALAESNGVPADAHLGRRVRDVVPDLWPKLEPLYRRALAGEPVVGVEGNGRTSARPGESRCWLASYYPVTAGGRVIGVGVVVVEITAQKRAERRLRDDDRRKDEFLATLAHELRNPLAPVRNAVQILQLSADAHPTVAPAAAVLDRQVGQMVRLVDDLLDVSRITRGKVELRRERLAVAGVLEAAVETARPLIDAAGHALAVDLPAAPLVVDGDPLRLAQVVANLLTNAARYTPRGGRIRLSAAADGGHAVVRVRDTGVGIPADMLTRVFDLFRQVDRPHEKEAGGLGIGLSLVKALVEMHGGTVTARSDGDGAGSEFEVRLPLWKDEGGRVRGDSKPLPDSALSTQHSALTVLVVDDNRDAADSMGTMLRLLGHKPVVAYGGEAGVAAGGRAGPRVVFMDLGMPGIDGYEACRRMRATDWGRRAVLVALTGWATDADRRKTADTGFDHHLTKPVDPADLRRLLAEVGGERPA